MAHLNGKGAGQGRGIVIGGAAKEQGSESQEKQVAVLHHYQVDNSGNKKPEQASTYVKQLPDPHTKKPPPDAS
ncbi:hypothetical protein [Hymenobacter sp. DG25A]|uniref:hypothetical protein n=1 Tax=Hymenobacter sp. DG25A TaxID=1385663 RepID=UPI0006BDFBA1|nr:hypothetical protein [Hymenobacter sp. DG25A]ALD21368.1 hypothetical protein AM218_09265 [Hymenobacter sp. DG25A]